MKKKITWWQTVLLLAFGVALCFASWQIGAVGNHLQYLFPAPAPVQPQSSDDGSEQAKPNQAIADLEESFAGLTEEWQGMMRHWTLDGVIERADFSGSSDSAQGRLYLMGEKGMLLHPLYLLSGRIFLPEELSRGEKVILLDEQLALKLFRISEPIDWEVELAGEKYRVVGVVRHSKQVGDLTDYGAYIPLNSVLDTMLTLDVLQVEAEPLPGVGAAVAFSNTMQSWQQGGTTIDLGKEGMAAALWLRVLGFIVGMTAVLRFVRWLNHRVSYYGRRYRQQLRLKYASRLMPELIGAILLFTLGYGAAALLAALVMNEIIQPVYTFTEWIPAVLVEWEDIADAFWKVWQLPAVMRELRSPELLRLRWLTLMVQGCSAGAGLVLALWYAKLRTGSEGTAEGLKAMYREGVAVSVVRTARPIAMADLGYMLCANSDAWHKLKVPSRRWRATEAMVRIVDARRVIDQLPCTRHDGSFVLEITDSVIERNNRRWLITCKQGRKTVAETDREWDMQLPVSILTQIVYGKRTFADYLENNTGYTMRMRTPMMDDLFDQHLPVETHALS